MTLSTIVSYPERGKGGSNQYSGNCTPLLIDKEVVRTKDTKRILEEDEGAFYSERTGEWYDSWRKMVVACFKSGMSKEEIREGLDLDNDGFMYWTTFCF